jgi:hypothetical protein
MKDKTPKAGTVRLSKPIGEKPSTKVVTAEAASTARTFEENGN